MQVRYIIAITAGCLLNAEVFLMYRVDHMWPEVIKTHIKLNYATMLRGLSTD